MSIKNTAIFAVNLYILINIIFGQNGVIEIYKLNKKSNNLKEDYQLLVQKNYIERIKSNMLNDERIDLRYLEELLRTQYSFADKNERVVFLR